ncbi:hypothetical protein PILCRDRAFT_828480, partial [Piloderma croceum F 1598]
MGTDSKVADSACGTLRLNEDLLLRTHDQGLTRREPHLYIRPSTPGSKSSSGFPNQFSSKTFYSKLTC